MFAPMAHFLLTEVTDPEQHAEETELQELYHRPELLSQPGVAWGDRWMRDAECAAATAICHADFALHYAAMYWLRAPAHQSARGFVEHFERAAQLGLRSEPWIRCPFDAFMVPLKGYVCHDRLVSEDALPFRPMKGVYLTVSRFAEHRGVEAEDIFRWHDQVRIPDLLECEGVAGAWTFASRALFAPDGDQSKPVTRVQLFYLEIDPVEFAREIAGRETTWAKAGRSRDTGSVEEIFFAGPLRSIIPWRAAQFAAPSRREKA